MAPVRHARTQPARPSSAAAWALRVCAAFLLCATAAMAQSDAGAQPVAPAGVLAAADGGVDPSAPVVQAKGGASGTSASAAGAAQAGKTKTVKKPVFPPKPVATPGVPPPPRLCAGDYADALPANAATKIAEANSSYVFAIRNTSTYEHVYYGKDGKLRKQYIRAVAHGTGFAYRSQNGETLIATNEHVASRPEVTDDDHTVEGVPFGSKKVREQLKIVKDESDDYLPGHVPLTKVLSDPAADIAVIKAKKTLSVMPWRLGRSAALRAGNLVQVRGFPLGAFAALSQGKVVNPYTEDTDKAWMHTDFVVDALLSGGNSGSPVFAVSCLTGEPELVGIFHAGYNDAAALNVVVAIDQLRDELDTLKVPKREQRTLHEVMAADRDRMFDVLKANPTHSLVFPYGARAVRVALAPEADEDAKEALRFSLLDDDFPLLTRETMGLIDRAGTGYGTLDALVFPQEDAEVEVPVDQLDADAKDHFERLYDGLWHQLIAVDDLRQKAGGRLSADAFADVQELKGKLKKRVGEQKELLGLVAFDTDRAAAVGRLVTNSPDGGGAAASATASAGAAGLTAGGGTAGAASGTSNGPSTLGPATPALTPTNATGAPAQTSPASAPATGATSPSAPAAASPATNAMRSASDG